jgi:imidazolonepropionase-like amidohydrolase
VFRHGDNYREPVSMVRLGMRPAQALRACTSVAARILHQSERFGRIAPGLRADLVAFEGDPSVRIDDLRHPLLVMKDGIVYRSPEGGGPVAAQVPAQVSAQVPAQVPPPAGGAVR